MAKQQPARLLDVVHGFKTGTLKLADVRPGIRKTVQRMAGEMSVDELAGYVKAPSTPTANAGYQERTRRARTF